jgi:4-hydroxyphenylpyruvate dioxygenase
MKLERYDYIQLYVGNAYQAMQFFRNVYGFSVIGYAGLETGKRSHVSYALALGDMRLVVTSPLDPDSSMSEAVRIHGDSVREIAFRVDNVEEAFNLALLRGALPVSEPAAIEDNCGQVKTATISSCTGPAHTFIERSGYTGAFLPGFKSVSAAPPPANTGLLEVDHIAISLPGGKLDEAVEFYINVLDLELKHVENIVTQHSAMNSKVVQNSSGTVRFPMMEPVTSKRTSQIEEYLKYNHGPGVQHLACSSRNIVETVSTLRKAGVEFLPTPRPYYDFLTARVGSISEDVAVLRDLDILVDRDEWGYLLQIFTRPVTSRPTLFMEVIQREGARGFGSGNIRALFDAVEREQAMRGNL